MSGSIINTQPLEMQLCDFAKRRYVTQVSRILLGSHQGLVLRVNLLSCSSQEQVASLIFLVTTQILCLASFLAIFQGVVSHLSCKSEKSYNKSLRWNRGITKRKKNSEQTLPFITHRQALQKTTKRPYSHLI